MKRAVESFQSDAEQSLRKRSSRICAWQRKTGPIEENPLRKRAGLPCGRWATWI